MANKSVFRHCQIGLDGGAGQQNHPKIRMTENSGEKNFRISYLPEPHPYKSELLSP